MRCMQNDITLFSSEGMNMKSLDYYMKLPYKTEIVNDTVEGGYLLYCPELNGCMTCAENVEKGLEMLEDAKRE